MTSDPRDEVPRSDMLERALAIAETLHNCDRFEDVYNAVLAALRDVREADADHASDLAAKEARIVELEKEVERLTAMLNTDIRGCNQGHLTGEPLP